MGEEKKSTRTQQIRISQSTFIDYDVVGEAFDEAYLMVVRESIDKLNSMGRDGERITWEQGPSIPGRPFPLLPEYDGGTHHFIMASCRIPIDNVNVKYFEENVR